jgi:putative membrane-bound dehydrogenase-like protein
MVCLQKFHGENNGAVSATSFRMQMICRALDLFVEIAKRACLALAVVSALAGHAAPLGSPLSPQEEQASFRLADESLAIELVAAEPQVTSPVALAWDADGRLFVAEMIDYPTGPRAGRIRMLEDIDADGRYSKATVFADGLAFPNSVLPWNGGVLVTAAPDILFLKDTDGDGRADERHVLFAGFGEGNQQLRVNGLTWGLDNWIYGANGRSEGEVRRAGDTNAQAISIRGHDFRFRPDTLAFEPIAGRSQFGVARDDWGNRFLSWNTIPIRHEVIPERYLARNPLLPTTEAVHDVLAPGDNSRVFPISPTPQTFNNESVVHFNALAGLTIYRGDALGEKYRGNAFVGESLRNLVHRRVLEASGVTFVAKRGEEGREFLASTDPWFHPVNFATAPDGALYIADFYRKWVEHPGFVHSNARDEIDWREGAQHGRIWRVVPQSGNRNGRSQISNPKLSRASAAELVRHLEDANGWWRDTAQRLLVERQDRAAIAPLQKLAKKSRKPEGRLHALYILSGLGALQPTSLIAAFNDPNPFIREQAIRLTEPFLAQGFKTTASERKDLIDALDRLSADDDRVRLQLALTWGELNDDTKWARLEELARRDWGSHWHELAVLSSGGNEPLRLLGGLLPLSSSGQMHLTAERAPFLNQLARQCGLTHNEPELDQFVRIVIRMPVEFGGSAQLVALAGWADGLAESKRSLRQWIANPPPSLTVEIPVLEEIIDRAVHTAGDPAAKTFVRLAAIRVLARVDPKRGKNVLLTILREKTSVEIQTAAALAVIDLDDAALANALFDRWSDYYKGTRNRILAATVRRSAATVALADALEKGLVQPIELDPPTRQAFLRTRDSGIKRRIETILKSDVSRDREEVIRRYQPSLNLAGNARAGAAIFARNCMVCHAVQNEGGRIGPDLSGLASRPNESVLIDILDPSREVSADFLSYEVVNADGESTSGLMVSETSGSLTLRRANLPDETILRGQIKELRASGKSLMPDGLEQGLSVQDVADLLAFLRQPDVALLPAER